MNKRHSQYDVSNAIDVSDSQAVCNAVCDILHSCHPGGDDSIIRRAFEDFNSLFDGFYKDYSACDTYYHDKQHTLDMTLAVMRLIDGHEKQCTQQDAFGAKLTNLAIITALFHDSGYIRKTSDKQHHNGAQYTAVHVSRSAQFLRNYLNIIGLPEFAEIAASMVHYTGYEVSPENIRLPDKKLHLLGYIIGTADLIAQMSDRCYLEKCRDRLFLEFELGGLTTTHKPDNQAVILFKSADDLLARTPSFYNFEVKNRLDNLFRQVYKYAEIHFGENNLYLQYLNRNIQYLETLISADQLSELHRLPPENPGVNQLLT